MGIIEKGGVQLTSRAMLSLLTALVLFTAAGPASAGSNLPDEGIRRRLVGCWDAAQPNLQFCFDGVARTTIGKPEAGDPEWEGTFTVNGGRLLFDLSLNDNPPNERYPSCAIKIDTDGDPHTFALDHCSGWTNEAQPGLADGLHAIEAQGLWLSENSYRGKAASHFNGKLKGCWSRAHSRERKQFLAKNPLYLSSFDICFDSETAGKVSWTTLDFQDGWEDSSVFEIVDGRLAITYEPKRQTRCTVEMSGDSLSMFDCVVWQQDEHGRYQPGWADEPAVFTRTKD